MNSAKNLPRVLIVDLAKYYGGADVRVLELARTLQAHAYPYSVASLDGSPLHRQLEKEGLSVLPVPFSRGNPRLVPFLVRTIRQQKFAVIDAHNSQSQFWGQLAAALAGRVKVVSTVHSAYRPEHSGSLKGRLYEKVLRLNVFGNTHFVAVSEAVERYLQNIGVPDERISLIHNSLRLPGAHTRDHRAALLESLGWESNAYVVIVVARLEPVKGHSTLLHAMKLTAAKYPQLRCLVVGEGRMRAALEAKMDAWKLQGRVHFTGFRNDVTSLLAASDAFCLPSLSEGLPYALLEASAHRLPVLASNVGGMAALLTHQENAFLVPPGDPQSLADGLGWLVDHRREGCRLGQAAFDLVQGKFNCDEMVSETIAVYQQPVPRRKLPRAALAPASKAEAWKA